MLSQSDPGELIVPHLSCILPSKERDQPPPFLVIGFSLGWGVKLVISFYEQILICSRVLIEGNILFSPIDNIKCDCVCLP